MAYNPVTILLLLNECLGLGKAFLLGKLTALDLLDDNLYHHNS